MSCGKLRPRCEFLRLIFSRSHLVLNLYNSSFQPTHISNPAIIFFSESFLHFPKVPYMAIILHSMNWSLQGKRGKDLELGILSLVLSFQHPSVHALLSSPPSTFLLPFLYFLFHFQIPVNFE